MDADVFKGWHPKNHIGKADQYSPHAIGRAGNEVWSNGEWSEKLKAIFPVTPDLMVSD
jgi:hypothetical protein